MKRAFLIALAALFCIVSCVSQPSGTSASTTPSDGLKFDENGELKIAQFTDLHFVYGNPASNIVLKRIAETFETEKPDLTVFTGDLIYSDPGDKPLRQILDLVQSYGVPFCVTFGNHDPDLGLSRAELYDIMRSYDCCLMPDRGDAESPDYALPVLSHDGSAPAALLYFFDSNAHLFDADGNFECYDFIHPDQVENYRARSAAFTAAAGGNPLPALAFFHIPLPEFETSLGADAPFIGTKMESVCSPRVNTGLFDAFREMGDVFGVFCGHDHDNDYAVLYGDILLAYGRFTGGNTEYNNLPNGARIIVLKESRRSLDSWIRLHDGVILNRLTCPDSFRQHPWRDRPLDAECLQGL